MKMWTIEADKLAKKLGIKDKIRNCYFEKDSKKLCIYIEEAVEEVSL
jgi:hypothetical protein